MSPVRSFLESERGQNGVMALAISGSVVNTSPEEQNADSQVLSEVSGRCRLCIDWTAPDMVGIPVQSELSEREVL